jgi:hypothetical protein
MTDIVKGILDGAWALIFGWVLPTFLSLQLIAWLILPSWTDNESIRRFMQTSTAGRQAILLAIAVVLGVVLATLKSRLYRILEGYWLWPQWLADLAIKRQISRQKRYQKQSDKARADGKSLRHALIYEKVLRFPAAEDKFAPTSLGNAIRRFETYAGDRYNLDSQLLWHHLYAAVPDRLAKTQEDANTNVDFFICLIYGSITAALGAAGTLLFRTPNGKLWFALAMGIAVARMAYLLALNATDEWDRTVRTVVDYGRFGMAKAFGLEVPHRLTDERDMWRAVNTLVRRPYAYSVSSKVPERLDEFRIKPSTSETPEASTEPVAYNGARGAFSLWRLRERPWHKS